MHQTIENIITTICNYYKISWTSLFKEPWLMDSTEKIARCLCIKHLYMETSEPLTIETMKCTKVDIIYSCKAVSNTIGNTIITDLLTKNKAA